MIASPHLALCFVVCTLTVNESFFLNVGDVYAVAMASNLFLQRRAASSRFPHILDLFVPIEVETRALRLFPASPRVHFVPRRCRLHGATESRDVESFGNAGRVSQQIQNGLCCFLTNNSSIHPFILSPGGMMTAPSGILPTSFEAFSSEMNIERSYSWSFPLSSSIELSIYTSVTAPPFRGTAKILSMEQNYTDGTACRKERKTI